MKNKTFPLKLHKHINCKKFKLYTTKILMNDILKKKYMTIDKIINREPVHSTIRPVSPVSHWPPTVFLPHQHLLQKDAA